jgi:hypothetical protein
MTQAAPEQHAPTPHGSSAHASPGKNTPPIPEHSASSSAGSQLDIRQHAPCAITGAAAHTHWTHKAAMIEITHLTDVLFIRLTLLTARVAWGI